ncbi:MAG: histidine kinase dimerization/phospho-acceptor domain-containing protein [Phycisphaerae bacterium]
MPESADVRIPMQEFTQDELFALERKSIAGDGAALLAHEVNNVLTPLMTFADFALQTGQQKDLAKALEIALRQGQRAVDLVRRFADFAKDRSPETKAVGVQDALDEALAILARPLEKDRIRLASEIAEDAMISADPVLFSQLLLILIRDARTALHDGGGSMRLHAASEGEEVRIELSDSRNVSADSDKLHARAAYCVNPAQLTSELKQKLDVETRICGLIVKRFDALMKIEPDHAAGYHVMLRWPVAVTAAPTTSM